MAILVTCRCGVRFETGDEFAGRRATCPECGGRMVIPRTVQAPAPVAPSAAPHGNENGKGKADGAETEFSSRAILSLVLGTMSLVAMCLTGIPAVICGALALSEINQSRGRLRGKWLAVVGLCLGAFGSTAVSLLIMTPVYSSALETGHQVQCKNNLTRLSFAFHKFLSQHDRYPASAITDRQGRPLLSWRVVLLPYLGDDEAKLYEQFHLDEPWDSPHNAALIPKMPAVFACPDEPARPPGRTIYQVLVGPNTMFTGARRGVKYEEIVDGSSATILFGEAARAVVWTAHDDLTLSSSSNSKLPLWGLGSRHPGGFFTVFADGSVRFVDAAIAPANLSGLSTRNGGEAVTPPF